MDNETITTTDIKAAEIITATQVVFPVALIAFVIALFLGFQTTMLLSDRDNLHQAYDQQARMLEQASKLKAQLNALAVGTLKLSQSGDKDATAIINQLSKNGVNVSDKPLPQAPLPQATTNPPGMPQ